MAGGRAPPTGKKAATEQDFGKRRTNKHLVWRRTPPHQMWENKSPLFKPGGGRGGESGRLQVCRKSGAFFFFFLFRSSLLRPQTLGVRLKPALTTAGLLIQEYHTWPYLLFM